jgi:hypothetical protein
MIIGGYADKQPQDVQVNKVVELYNPDTDDRKSVPFRISIVS